MSTVPVHGCIVTDNDSCLWVWAISPEPAVLKFTVLAVKSLMYQIAYLTTKVVQVVWTWMAVFSVLRSPMPSWSNSRQLSCSLQRSTTTPQRSLASKSLANRDPSSTSQLRALCASLRMIKNRLRVVLQHNLYSNSKLNSPCKWVKSVLPKVRKILKWVAGRKNSQIKIKVQLT